MKGTVCGLVGLSHDTILYIVYQLYAYICTIFILFPELSEKLNVELSELRVTYYQLKEEHQQLQDKMKFYNKVRISCTIV